MKAKRIGTVLAACVSFVLAAGGCSSAGPADSVRLKLANPVGPAGAPGQSLRWISEGVADATDDSVEIDIFDSATLVPATEGLAGVQDGRTDLALTYSSYQAAQMPLFSIADVPFVTRNGVAAAYAFKDLYEENETFRAEFERLGIVPVAFVPVGNAAMGFTEPFTSLDQLKGKRVRVPGDRVASAVAQFGAEGTSVDFTEGYEALQRGVIDGWVGTEMASVADASWFEVTPYFVQGGLGTLTHAMVFISQSAWDRLSEEQQSQVKGVGDDYLAWIDNEFGEMEAEACDKVLDGGGSVETIPADQVEKWKGRVGESALGEVRANAEKTGVSAEDFDSFYDEYVQNLRDHEKNVTYEDGLEACAQR